MLKTETLTRGAVVEVKTTDGDTPGMFVGTVVFVNENGARIRPASKDIREYLGGDGTYVLGSAHWPARLSIIG